MEPPSGGENNRGLSYGAGLSSGLVLVSSSSPAESCASRPMRATPPVIAARLITPDTHHTASDTEKMCSDLKETRKHVTMPAVIATTMGTSEAVRPAAQERSSPGGSGCP